MNFLFIYLCILHYEPVTTLMPSMARSEFGTSPLSRFAYKSTTTPLVPSAKRISLERVPSSRFRASCKDCMFVDVCKASGIFPVRRFAIRLRIVRLESPALIINNKKKLNKMGANMRVRSRRTKLS